MICVRVTQVVAVAVLGWSLGFKLTKVRFAPAVCCRQQAAAHALCGVSEVVLPLH